MLFLKSPQENSCYSLNANQSTNSGYLHYFRAAVPLVLEYLRTPGPLREETHPSHPSTASDPPAGSVKYITYK